MRPFVLMLLLPALAVPARAEVTISGVTLSTAGLAMLKADAQMEDAALNLSLRRSDIDAFLKSLLIADPAGGIPTLTMAGPRGLSDVFAALPFTPDDLRNLPDLALAMIGAPATALRNGFSASGALMGLHHVPCDPPAQAECQALSLRSNTGQIQHVLLDADTVLQFDDAEDRLAMARGLNALRRDARNMMLDVQISSTESGPRRIELGWLQPAPAWATTWRAEDGPDGMILTAWAIVENATGQDWIDVELTLATGAVQVLQPQLYDNRPVARPSFEPALEAAAMDAAPAMRAGSMASEFEIAPAAIDDGDSFSRFTLSTPVTLDSGQIISLPFLRETIEDGRLVLYQGGSGAQHPMMGLDIENPLPLRLPAGVLTVYKTGRGHAGDAMIPELAPGAREWVSFAQDRAIRLREDTSDIQRLQSARIVDGVLVAQERLERTTRYRIEGAAQADRNLIIAHPRRAGWEMQTSGGTDMLDETRFTLSVPAGNIITHDVTEARITATRIALRNLDDNALAFWSGRVPDADTRAVLQRVQDLRAREALLTRELALLEQQQAELIADQERLVALIVQLGNASASTDDRRARVDEIDTELHENRRARSEMQQRLDGLRNALRGVLAAAD